MTSLLIWGLIALLQQSSAQQSYKQFLDERHKLQAQAKQAFEREMDRERKGDCTNAATTYATNTCLAGEGTITEVNYKAFEGALRDLLAQINPMDTMPRAPGPTGLPRTREELLQEFDGLQAAWSEYEKRTCDAAYDQYKGGTLAPSFEMGCAQMLTRSHLRELNFVYGGLFL